MTSRVRDKMRRASIITIGNPQSGISQINAYDSAQSLRSFHAHEWRYCMSKPFTVIEFLSWGL